MTFTESRWRFFTNFSHRMNTIRRDVRFCDVFLTIDGRSYGAHRAILAASCDYFRALFTTSMIEKNMKTIKLEIPASIIEELLTFLYTGDTILCESNVKEMLVAADYLMLEDLKHMCADYLASGLSSFTCLQIYYIALRYNCQELKRKAESFVLKQFPLLRESDDFMFMDNNQLQYMISSDDLNVKGEDEVFQALVAWVNYNLHERELYFDELFKNVRLCSLSEEYVLDKVVANALVRQSNVCMSIVHERLQLKITTNDQIHQLRKCLRTKDQAVICIGGRTSGKALKNTLSYSPYHDKWMQLEDMPIQKEEHVVVMCNDKLYVIGGMKTPNSIECFDHGVQSWSTIARLPQKAISSAGVCVDGKIYIIGGKDGFKSVSTVQCYNPLSNTVESLPSLQIPREALCAVALNGEIYSIGGCAKNDTFNTVEKLNLSNERTWQPVPSMKHSRKYACAEVLKSGNILIIGGYCNTSPTALNNCEVYNPASNDWYEVCSLVAPRAAAGSAYIGDKVYIVGGRSDRISVDTMEYYDEDEDRWYMVPTRLPYPYAWLQCSVVSVTKFLPKNT